ncbi:Uu.00g091970.m01.CDS01 [Anthostomella pinea]|uniref:Uu.00g091970.m01.CDS01 n=1 Tax=Anthostomella pinea TaxID=933095 RepID=A0AAI8YKA9_9PEZI|nr:Uu.00g091970.m01.CDS01 [Anthostomella pinea]
MTVSKQTVLITGCSEGGIGDALAWEFHQRGLRVFATARNPDKVKHLQAAGIEILTLDVVDKTSIRNALQEISKLTGGTLNILVNNSGVGYQMPLLDADLDEARRLFEVNVWGTLAVSQACAPLLAAAAAEGMPARILNIGSVVARMQVPWQGIYNASKSALWGLNDTLRIELAPFGIEVLHVVTGGIQTKFFAHAAGARLPEDSIYGPARGIIEADVAGKGGVEKQTMSAEEYAKIVVRNTLSRRPTKTLWLGGMARLSWIGDRFGWATLVDWLMANFMGWSMKGLEAKLRAAK